MSFEELESDILEEIADAIAAGNYSGLTCYGISWSLELDRDEIRDLADETEG